MDGPRRFCVHCGATMIIEHYAGREASALAENRCGGCGDMVCNTCMNGHPCIPPETTGGLSAIEGAIETLRNPPPPTAPITFADRAEGRQ